jgi:hypothetical protein
MDIGLARSAIIPNFTADDMGMPLLQHIEAAMSSLRPSPWKRLTSATGPRSGQCALVRLASPRRMPSGLKSCT